MPKKNLKQILAACLVGTVAFLPLKEAKGVTSNELFVLNYNNTAVTGIPSKQVGFCENFSWHINFVDSQPSFDIFSIDGTNNYDSVGVDTSSNSVFQCPLRYSGEIPDGTTNSIRFHFVKNISTPSNTNTFPHNVLITSKTIADGGITNVTDVVKSVNESGLGYYEVPLSLTD